MNQALLRTSLSDGGLFHHTITNLVFHHTITDLVANDRHSLKRKVRAPLLFGPAILQVQNLTADPVWARFVSISSGLLR